MLIRAAQPNDAPLLTVIAFAAKQHWGYSQSAMQSWTDDLTVTSAAIESNPTFLAEENATPVAFYMLSAEGADWELEHFWVAPQSMRRGIGTMLFKHALEVARRHGGTVLHIDADPNAERFYLACGARRMGSVAAPIPDDLQRTRPLLTLPLC